MNKPRGALLNLVNINFQKKKTTKPTKTKRSHWRRKPKTKRKKKWWTRRQIHCSGFEKKYTFTFISKCPYYELAQNTLSIYILAEDDNALSSYSFTKSHNKCMLIGLWIWLLLSLFGVQQMDPCRKVWINIYIDIYISGWLNDHSILGRSLSHFGHAFFYCLCQQRVSVYNIWYVSNIDFLRDK